MHCVDSDVYCTCDFYFCFIFIFHYIWHNKYDRSKITRCPSIANYWIIILPQHGCINDSTPINWPNIFAALLSLIDHVVVRFKAAYAFHTH